MDPVRCSFEGPGFAPCGAFGGPEASSAKEVCVRSWSVTTGGRLNRVATVPILWFARAVLCWKR